MGPHSLHMLVAGGVAGGPSAHPNHARRERPPRHVRHGRPQRRVAQALVTGTSTEDVWVLVVERWGEEVDERVEPAGCCIAACRIAAIIGDMGIGCCELATSCATACGNGGEAACIVARGGVACTLAGTWVGTLAGTLAGAQAKAVGSGCGAALAAALGNLESITCRRVATPRRDGRPESVRHGETWRGG